MSSELKACECGGKPKITLVKVLEDKCRWWEIRCTKCPVMVKHLYKEKAITAWNNRLEG